MNSLPLITVIVPVYNSERYLDKCISSIVNQTYNNLEILLINDGSSDSSKTILDSWAEKDMRITAIHKENEGDVATRNRGIELATGEYVIIIDNDDYMDTDMIEFLYSLITENGADISRCGFWFEYEDGRAPVRAGNDSSVKVLNFEEKIIDLLMSDHLSGVIWNKLYKSELIKNYRLMKEDGASDDFLFNYRILLDNPKVAFCDIPKHHYLIRANSMTNSKFGEGAFAIIRAKKMLLERFKNDNKIYPYAVKSYIVSAFIVLTGCIKHKYYEKYSDLSKSITDFYPFVMKSNLFSKSEKLKVTALKFTPKIYHNIIRKKYKV